MPSGLRKPPKHEPAVLRRRSTGISRFARLRWLLTRIVSAVCGNLMREIFRWGDGESGPAAAGVIAVPRWSWRKTRPIESD
jgi:hypothetical protein